MKNIKPAMMTVGGWFDAEDVYGPLSIYSWAEENSPGATNMIVEGPWSHGGWARQDATSLGNISFASNTSKFYQDEIEFPFFNYHLKGKGDGNKLPEAYMFETGRNEWHKLDAWPPKQAKSSTLYFHPQGKLSTSAPAGTAAFDEYVSDPMKPVPFTPYITNRMDYAYMTDDPAACTNCHVMREQFDGWLKSSHQKAAVCNDCHTPPGLIGKYTVKAINGFNHSMAFTTGRFPDNIHITGRNQRVAKESCLKCHQEMTNEMNSARRHGDDADCVACHRNVGHAH